VVTVGDRPTDASEHMDIPTLERRIQDWDRLGYDEDIAYDRGPIYGGPSMPSVLNTTADWWVNWMEADGPQPFDWATYCPDAPGITPNGEVLRCWLEMNPLVALSIIWEEILPNDQVHPDPYPFWPESRKQELDEVFYAHYQWLASGLAAPFPIPPDPSPNLIPSTYAGTNIVLSEHNAWLLYSATVAHCLALEIGGFVPWSVLDYGVDDLGALFHSNAMFKAKVADYDGQTIAGYAAGGMLAAYPKTCFEFFIDQDIVRSTHNATITRLLGWSGANLWHYASFNGDTDGKTPMQVAYMHWQYYGDAPAQRMLAGTIRDNTNAVHHWTRGCSGTSRLYRSILRTLNIPARTLWGWGEGIEPHLGGHTVPVFPTIGKTLSHGDDMLNWTGYVAKVSPPPSSVSPSKLYISWNTFVDWFWTNPSDNVGRRKYCEIPIEVLDDDVLDLYCADLAAGLPETQSSVYERFSEYYTHAELVAKGLWVRLADKAAALNHCGN
jgi:hypothetical protein